jgi:hypothetical protein
MKTTELVELIENLPADKKKGDGGSGICFGFRYWTSFCG